MEKVLSKFQEELRATLLKYEELGICVIAATEKESFMEIHNSDLIQNSIINACIQDKNMMDFFVGAVDIALDNIDDRKDSIEKETPIIIPFTPGNKIVN